jgi:DNA-binding CsgD family transcriptional regulator
MAVVEIFADRQPPPPLKTAHAVVAALDLVGIPAAILGHAGQLMAWNRRFERLVPGLVREHKERLRFVNTTADELLEAALTSFGHRQSGKPVRSIPIAATGVLPPMIIHLLGVEGVFCEPGSGALALVAVAVVLPRDVPGIPVIQGLFDLTPAEARVAQAVAQCHTLSTIATKLGLSLQTLRSQLRVALAKAGCRRNIDLAALLAGVDATFD